MSSLRTASAPPVANVFGGVNTAQVAPAASSSLIASALPVPGSGRYDGRRFQVRASGNIATHTTSNVTVTLYAALPTVTLANMLTTSNMTLLKASTARSVVAGATTGCPWYLSADLIFDSTDGNLQGSAGFMINNLYDATAALTNVLTGLNDTLLTNNEPAFFLVLAFTFGTADAVSYIATTEFEVCF
jgi:hypothetical protein